VLNSVKNKYNMFLK